MQPPEQQKQQQGYQCDNYQVLQITFSAETRKLMEAQCPRLTTRWIFTSAAAFFSPIR